jgi:putative tryptophan/tyrosine transport system substrate-binding protein
VPRGRSLYIPALAQTSEKIPRVGILSPADSDSTPIFQAFRQGLRDRGYIEGRNIILEFRLAHGDYAAFPKLAAELVNIPVNVIVTDGGLAPVRIAQQASSHIPIVMGAGTPDAVALGLVQSYARPGGNVTGFTLMQTDLTMKRVDLLRTAFPDATAMTVLLNPSNEGAKINFRAADQAARSAGLTIHRLEAADPEKLSGLSPTLLANAPVLVLPDATFWNHRGQILALVEAARLPAIYPEREYADEGGLIAYGPNVPDNFRRAAAYVDQILKGAKAGDLPLQEPAKFDFVVNLKTAKALGITISPAILVRAAVLETHSMSSSDPVTAVALPTAPRLAPWRRPLCWHKSAAHVCATAENPSCY